MPSPNERSGQAKSSIRSFCGSKGHRPNSASSSPVMGKGGRGKGQRRQHRFRHWTDEDVRAENDRLGGQLDDLTRTMQVGTLTTDQKLTRPYRGRPMFVGAMITGFGGDWIRERSCIVCGVPHDLGRCEWCQAGGSAMATPTSTGRRRRTRARESGRGRRAGVARISQGARRGSRRS